MSKYTTELRYICENYAGLNKSEGYASVSDIIDNSREKIFDFDYPIFDASYKNVLESKIIKHFYLREICAETVGVWKHFLDMRMNEIMPYYNKLYESELIEFNPLYDVDLTKDYNKDDKGTGTLVDALQESDNRDIVRTDGEARHLSANGTNTGTVKDTGTVTDTGTVKDTGTVTDTGTVKDTGTVTDTGDVKHTGTVKDTGTVTDTGTDTNAKTGTTSDVKKNTKWDIYSDTPQGGLTNVENETYLTNARKIVDDGTGSLVTHNTTDTETKNLTKTNNLTRTDDLKDENNLTRTNDLTRTDNLTKTNDLTRTDNLTKTNDLTRTDNLASSLTEDETNNKTSRIDDDNTKSSNNTRTRNLRDIEDYIEHVKGKSGGVSFSKLLQEFRDTFLNIDTMIINDLNDLFFGLW